jgi:hypothetical protein
MRLPKWKMGLAWRGIRICGWDVCLAERGICRPWYDLGLGGGTWRCPGGTLGCSGGRLVCPRWQEWDWKDTRLLGAMLVDTGIELGVGVWALTGVVLICYRRSSIGASLDS